MSGAGRGLDAVVVGAGPNGLVAAVTIARAGRSVLVLEAADEIGGGTRTEELTLPGFLHDLCSTAHPTALASPALRQLHLGQHGLRWRHAPRPLAHPFDTGPAALLEGPHHPPVGPHDLLVGAGESPSAPSGSREPTEAELPAGGVSGTADHLAPADAARWRALFGPLRDRERAILDGILGPLRTPRHPEAMLRFARVAVRSAVAVSHRFEDERARALVVGCAQHGPSAPWAPLAAAPGIVLSLLGQTHGWPFAEGGSASIARALAADLAAHGGTVEVGRPVRSMRDLPGARVTLFDLVPRGLLAIAGDRLGGVYRRRLAGFRHGPGVFKVDWALDGPIPWRDPEVGRAGVVHVGGLVGELRFAASEVAAGRAPERPFAVLAQATVADPSRAPRDRHTAWAWCHVPAGSDVDMTGRMEDQVERFAPGFRDLVVGRHAMGPAALEAREPNAVGGDISGGVMDWRQLFTRPVAARVPYRVPGGQGWYLCSSATPPGGGVHGMCGWWAARAALARELA